MIEIYIFMNLLKGLILTILLGLFTFSSYAQSVPRVAVVVPGNDFVAMMNNPFEVIAQQEKPIELSQLRAWFQTSFYAPKQVLKIEQKGDYFKIRPDSVGAVFIDIQFKDTILTKRIFAKPLTAVARLGSYSALTKDRKISSSHLKTIPGIVANVENFDIDARCRVLSYEVIRIPKKEIAKRAYNEGARFQEEAKVIIQQACAGDIFIFRNISYRCPAALHPQMMEDLIFDIE